MQPSTVKYTHVQDWAHFQIREFLLVPNKHPNRKLIGSINAFHTLTYLIFTVLVSFLKCLHIWPTNSFLIQLFYVSLHLKPLHLLSDFRSLCQSKQANEKSINGHFNVQSKHLSKTGKICSQFSIQHPINLLGIFGL